MKKIIMALIINCILFQNIQTVNPKTLTNGQKIYQFRTGRLYNTPYADNSLFGPITTVSISTYPQRTTTTLDGKTYSIVDDATKTLIGYVELPIVENETVWTDGNYNDAGNFLSLFDDKGWVKTGIGGYTVSAPVESYSTKGGGYVAIKGKNKAGHDNDIKKFNKYGDLITIATLAWDAQPTKITISYTVYSPVYGIEVL